MKNIIITLLALALGSSWAYFIYKDLRRIDIAQVPSFSTHNEQLNISRKVTEERINNYGQWASKVMKSREKAGAPKQDTLPVAWTISIDSLINIRRQEKITDIRVYLLLEEEVIPDPSENNFPILHLAAVGVFENRDLTEGLITNLIHPCPTVCDRSSPLWKAYVAGLNGEHPVDN